MLLKNSQKTMKKNSKIYKIPFNYDGEKCTIDIFYHRKHSKFSIVVSTNRLMETNELAVIENYLRSEGFFDDAKEFYDKLDNEKQLKS